MTSKNAMMFALIAGLLVIGVGSQAQENPTPRINPRDLMPMYFLSLTAADLLLMRDGSVVSGHVQNDQFTLVSDQEDPRTFAIDELIAVFFGQNEDEPDRVYLSSGDRLLGNVEADTIDTLLSLDRSASIPRDQIRGIFFQLPALESQRQSSIAVVRQFTRQFSGFFGSLIASAAKFETLVFAGGGANSVLLGNREELAFTFESSIFGTFTFDPTDLAWVRFGQRPGEPDELVLKNGDRVSGRVTMSGNLQFQWPSLGLTASLSEETVSSEVRQIVFKIPVRFFGGGGGHPRQPTEDEN